MSENMELAVKSELDKKVFDGEIVVGKKIEESEVEKSLNYDSLTKEEQKAIEEFNSKIEITDTIKILEYGAVAQNKISKFNDNLKKQYHDYLINNFGILFTYHSNRIEGTNNPLTLNDTKEILNNISY